MHLNFLTGPAGSGKSFRCVAEVQQRLLEASDELPLVFLVPKQATFQVERAILDHPKLGGFTRLHVLSFERLAHYIFEQLGQLEPDLISEEGRIMVLRSLLTQHQRQLIIFGQSSARKGFAAELSKMLHELQIARLSPEELRRVALGVSDPTLREKLNDLALLLDAYLLWLKAHNLSDADCLLEEATVALRTSDRKLRLGGLWMDGFGSLNPQERRLLIAIVPCTEVTTLAFCTESADDGVVAASVWNQVNFTKEKLKSELGAVESIEINEQMLVRRTAMGRFDGSPALAYLEAAWIERTTFNGDVGDEIEINDCRNAEEEVVAAARAILKCVQTGARYRDIAVLARSLEPWHELVQRIFKRYEIPFFIDRRENISHHPLANVTRSALRVVNSGWRHADIFNFLKSGLAPLEEDDVDWLENECLAYWGDDSAWKQDWKFPSHYKNEDDKARLIALRRKVNVPLERFEMALLLSKTANGFVAAVRRFWEELAVETKLESWNDSESKAPISVHNTVHAEMQVLLENLVRAFGEEKRAPSDWIMLLESGFENLSVGLIPQALDQVLVGAIDRSRNPDLKLTLLLGLNEGLFPQTGSDGVLLGEQDIDQLEVLGVSLGRSRKSLMQREQYLAYIAMTRSRERLIVSRSRTNSAGDPINPSILITRLQQLFPSLKEKPFQPINEKTADAALHPTELINLYVGDEEFNSWLIKERPLAPQCQTDEQLSPEMASMVYGARIKTSVSRFEQFAKCPFRFFVDSGLRAKERITYTLDPREKGLFQHAVLQKFHDDVKNSNKEWRDLKTDEAREIIGRIADEQMEDFSGGLTKKSARNQLVGAACKSSLQNLVEQLVRWMSSYEFDPVEAEFKFNPEQLSTLSYKLTNQKELMFSGSVDRIDLHRTPDGRDAFFVIIDYKSSQRKPCRLKLSEGIQQQLPAYLIMLRDFPEPQKRFGVETLKPAGMFYISLSGAAQSADRSKARSVEARNGFLTKTYQHHGVFSLEYKDFLDNRTGASKGEQISYEFKKDGGAKQKPFGALSPEAFHDMLQTLETKWKQMGEEIYAGRAAIQPYKIKKETACDQCSYASICRIDNWTHQNYRTLKEDHA